MRGGGGECFISVAGVCNLTLIVVPRDPRHVPPLAVLPSLHLPFLLYFPFWLAGRTLLIWQFFPIAYYHSPFDHICQLSLDIKLLKHNAVKKERHCLSLKCIKMPTWGQRGQGSSPHLHTRHLQDTVSNHIYSISNNIYRISTQYLHNSPHQALESGRWSYLVITRAIGQMEAVLGQNMTVTLHYWSAAEIPPYFCFKLNGSSLYRILNYLVGCFFAKDQGFCWKIFVSETLSCTFFKVKSGSENSDGNFIKEPSIFTPFRKFEYIMFTFSECIWMLELCPGLRDRDWRGGKTRQKF